MSAALQPAVPPKLTLAPEPSRPRRRTARRRGKRERDLSRSRGMLDNAVHEERYSTSTAVALWLGGLFGLCGLHRFYLGKPVSGLIWLFTFGLFGVGQIVDLVRMRRLVYEENLKLDGMRARALQAGARPLPAAPPRDPAEVMRQQLMQAAQQHGGMLSVSQGVMATGKDFPEVEGMLDDMARKGYVGISNHPDSGVLVYTFGEL